MEFIKSLIYFSLFFLSSMFLIVIAVVLVNIFDITALIGFVLLFFVGGISYHLSTKLQKHLGD